LKKAAVFISAKIILLPQFLPVSFLTLEVPTEGAFYLRFEQMPDGDKRPLKSYYGVEED
jgi:hypothetical protein